MKMRRIVVRALNCCFIFLIIISGCGNPERTDWYHPFSNRTWERFEILQFEIPISQSEKNYDIILFAYLSNAFEFKDLAFNMVMKTPSGEERINEYQLPFRTENGDLIKACTNDSCFTQVILKQQLRINKAGNLLLEIENLTPRLLTEGVCGVGIRVTPSDD